MNKKVAQIVTERILEQMEEAEELGVMYRWIKPFAMGAPDRPYSYDTLAPYRGVNRLLLDNSEFLTFKKIQELNQRADAPQYQIRKGARGHIVCYYNTVTVVDETTGEPLVDETSGEEVKRGYLKYYYVFSREDVVRVDTGENLPSKFEFQHYTHEEITEHMKTALDRFNRLFNYYCQKNGIEVQKIMDGTEAYFSHDMKIRLPDISNFDSLYNWVHTTAHEMIHSTGMFLGRFEDKNPMDIEAAKQQYSKEELIAEIGAEMLCNYLQIEDDSETPDNAVAYIQAWSSYLQNRPQEILSAAAKAETACDFLIEHLREMEQKEQQHVKTGATREEEEER